jgi:hypothetical protein
MILSISGQTADSSSFRPANGKKILLKVIHKLLGTISVSPAAALASAAFDRGGFLSD